MKTFCTRQLLSLACLLLAIVAQGQTAASPALADGRQRANIVEGYGRLPLAFEANQGQSDSQVKFLSRGAGYGLFLTSTEAVLTLSPSAVSSQHYAGAVLRMQLLSANPKTIVSGQDDLPGKSNYFIGNDPKKWHTDVRQYAKVSYANVYPGVDLVYYGNQRELEYDFVLRPGANPEQIRLGIKGADRLRLDHGDLVMTSEAGDVRLRSPHIYQEANGVRHEVPGGYAMIGKEEVGFLVASYDRNKALVIDPTLSYSTYLGGSGDDTVQSIAVDTAGNAYVTGGTISTDFPTVNPIQADFHGGGGGTPEGDVFVSKINADGSALIYSTYLGGNSDEVGRSIAVDSTGNVYLTGHSQSSDFPTVNPFQPTLHGWRNAIVAKINAAGNVLVYSTYLGGGEDDGHGIAVDSLGQAHVRGDTRSPSFPVHRALQRHLRSQHYFNCFVSEFTADGSALVYSTYWGGSVGEAGHGIAVDAAGNTYVGGSTSSPDFPMVNPIQPVLAGGGDAFLTKFSPDGQAVLYSTFLGGSGGEEQLGTGVDSFGNAYIVGSTSSTDFPTVNAVQPTNHGGIDGFVSKINAAGTALAYSTYLGGSADDRAVGIATDSAANAYITGITTSTDFPVVEALQPANHGGSDTFLTKIAGDGSSLLYSTYLGGSKDEGTWGDAHVAVDAVGSAYVAGSTMSVDFPITPKAFQQSLRGGLEGFVAKIAEGEPTTTALSSSLNPATYGQLITFTATVTSASGTPDGTVIFYDGSTQIGSGTLANGSTSVSVSSLAVGSHSITAAYQGAGDFVPSTSAPVSQAVNQATTNTSLQSSNPRIKVKWSVTYTATVTSQYGGTVTGTVAFQDNGVVVANVSLSGNQAKYTTSYNRRGRGIRVIVATYSGDGNNLGSISPNLVELINHLRLHMPTHLTSSQSPSMVGQPVTFTASLYTPYGPPPDGDRMYFFRNRSYLGWVAMVGGEASYTTSDLSAGSHAMRAVFGGDPVFRNSEDWFRQFVDRYTTTATLTSTPNPSQSGDTVTFTVQVTSSGPTPTGTVKFFKRGTLFASATLSDGVAVASTASLRVGTHAITAHYAGDAYNDKSTSAAVNQVVQ